MAHVWAQWLPKPCRLGGPQRSARGQNQKWPKCGHSGYLPRAISWVPYAFNEGENHKWPKCGDSGYLTPAVSGVPNALHGDKIRICPHVITVASKPLPLGGSPPLQSGGHNQKWPTIGQCGYITPAAWGVTTASERGAESGMAHNWARWLHNPCRLGGPHRFRAGGRIRSGPQVGKVAT